MLISIIYRSLYCCMLTGIHRSMERVTSDFRRSCLASSSSVFIVAINTCNTLQEPNALWVACAAAIFQVLAQVSFGSLLSENVITND